MPASYDSKKILVIHGPNLNMLGKRQPDIYGNVTLDQIDEQLKTEGSHMGFTIDTYQSNHEGDIVDRIQQASDIYQGLIINPGAYTHTSVAIRDALLILDVPVIEIHISNVYKRKAFRRHSMISDIVTAKITGFGVYGYTLALKGVIELLTS